MRWRKDAIDMACEQWARERRKIHGIILPSKLEPREMLGRMRCTLSAVREEGEGASQGTINQNFPEVYVGDALIVHRAFRSMRPEWRDVMNAQYVWAEIPPKIKVVSLGIELHDYWDRLSKLKIYLDAYLRSSVEVLEKA